MYAGNLSKSLYLNFVAVVLIAAAWGCLLSHVYAAKSVGIVLINKRGEVMAIWYCKKHNSAQHTEAECNQCQSEAEIKKLKTEKWESIDPHNTENVIMLQRWYFDVLIKFEDENKVLKRQNRWIEKLAVWLRRSSDENKKLKTEFDRVEEQIIYQQKSVANQTKEILKLKKQMKNFHNSNKILHKDNDNFIEFIQDPNFIRAPKKPSTDDWEYFINENLGIIPSDWKKIVKRFTPEEG